MKLIFANNIATESNETWSKAIHNFKDKLIAESDAMFYILKGVTYESKVDKYVAKFEAGDSTNPRTISMKCSVEAAQFLIKHSDRRNGNQWFVKIADGVIVDVTIFDYTN